MKLSFVFTILLGLSAVGLSAQTPDLKKYKDVVTEIDLMQEKAAFLKQHKKEYKYKNAKIETWTDGKTYIVASKNGNYSLFATDGHPLLIKDNNVKWFPAINVEKHDQYSLFILYGGLYDNAQKGIATDLHGIIYQPEDRAGSKYNVFRLNGEDFIKTWDYEYSSWPNSGMLYSMNNGKIFGKSEYVKNFSFSAESPEAVDSLKLDRTNIGIWHGSRKATYILTKFDSRDGRLNYHTEFITPGEPMFYLKGYYTDFVPGYGVLAEHTSNIKFSEKAEGNVPTYNIDLGYPTTSLKLVTSDGKIVIDSISKITAVGVDGVFLYRKVIGDYEYSGLLNLKNREKDIKPIFSDIYIETDNNGKWTPMVRKTLLAEAEKYDQSKIYDRSFNSSFELYLEYASADSILSKASEYDIATLSETDLIAVSRGIMRKYASYANSQEMVLKHYDIEKPIFENSHIGQFAERFFEAINPKSFSKESSMMLRIIEQLRYSNETLADRIEAQNDIILGDLLFNRDSLIPQKKAAYMERGTIETEKLKKAKEAIEQKNRPKRLLTLNHGPMQPNSGLPPIMPA